jgi:hypothetical protein
MSSGSSTPAQPSAVSLPGTNPEMRNSSITDLPNDTSSSAASASSEIEPLSSGRPHSMFQKLGRKMGFNKDNETSSGSSLFSSKPTQDTTPLGNICELENICLTEDVADFDFVQRRISIWQ